jgi:hypothetical protein
MSSETNDKNMEQVTGEELEKVNGGIGLNVVRLPRRRWEKKRDKSFLPPDEPADESKDGGVTGDW